MDTRMFEQISACVLLNAQHVEVMCCGPSIADGEPHWLDPAVWTHRALLCVSARLLCDRAEIWQCWRDGGPVGSALSLPVKSTTSAVMKYPETQRLPVAAN